MGVSRIAIIGSFRQHYEKVIQALEVFQSINVEITTPKGSNIIKKGISFVRFESDDKEWTDEMVQVVALHRILRADITFVVAPEGYVGRTTCYEIGRIIQAQKPIYFSEMPKDLPICIPDSNISSAINLSKQIESGTFKPMRLYGNTTSKLERLEMDLINGKYQKI
jgi:hypothetical protein